MNTDNTTQSLCLDVITHGINMKHPIEPKIGDEITIQGNTYACKKVLMIEESTSSCADCDMSRHLCACMHCIASYRADRHDVVFIKLA